MPALLPGQVKQLAYSAMNEKQIGEFEAKQEMNLSISAENLGRFRVNVFVQRGETGMVVRYIKNKIPPLAALGLPPVLEKLVLRKRGLVLVTGATGSGKSTTLASMINYRNENVTGHILTIEDPLEFLHAHKRSVVDQREVGIDTQSYEEALKNALREAPDVIMIGEIRDRETMSAAIAYAQSGHLCLATLHGNNSYHALNRILSFYPVEVRPTMLGDLGSALKAIISQRLVRTPQGARLPAVEVMLNTKLVADLIEKGDFSGVREAMEKSMAEGSQTFEEALAHMILDGQIDRKEGISHADSPTNLLWRLQNDFALASKAAQAQVDANQRIDDDQPSFTEIVLDVHPR